MADITRTKEQVSVVFTHKTEIDNGIAAVALEAGQLVYIDGNGKYAKADANGAGSNKFRGIALETVAAGQPVSVLVKGELFGYTLTGAYDSAVYVSETAGELADAAGSTSLVVGRIVGLPRSNGTMTKILKVTGWAG
jgi:hypothetical protein